MPNVMQCFERKSLFVSLAVIFMILGTSTFSSFASFQQPVVSSHPLERQTNGTSSNWSGYAAESSISNPSNNFVQSVSGSWTVPTVICSVGQATYVATWVGIDGYSDSTVEQTGTEQQCSSGGTASYYAWYEMYPQSMVQLSLTITPGDTITASVSYQGQGSFLITISDTSTHESYSSTQTLHQAKLQSAEWIVEAPSSAGGVLPLANFGTTSFSSAQYTTSGGTSYAIDGLGAGTFDAITMNDPANGATATPSSLADTTSSSTSSFNVVYGATSTITTTTSSSSSSSSTITTTTSSASTTATSTATSTTSTSTSTPSTYYFSNDLSSQTWLSGCQGSSNLFDPCTVTDSGYQFSVGQTSQANFNQPFTIVISGQSHGDRFSRDLVVQIQLSNGQYYTLISTTVSHSFSFSLTVPQGDLPTGCSSSCVYTASFELTTFTGSWNVNFGIAGNQ